jgi:hypothetical protein
MLGKNSTSTYWYLPDPPNVRNEKDLERYAQSWPSPFYLIDYRTRTNFRFESQDGILRLPYAEPLGPQINPEAAFQCALGWHDRHVLDNAPDAREQFINYASHFRASQSAQGDFSYLFDWFESKAPWHSALAQSRGASVMLRAFLLTGDETYATSARRALQRFDVDCEDGGYRAIFTPENVPYFEEYPAQKNAVINGFMASLFALYELAYWLNDEQCARLFGMGINSLENMLPHYTLPWWTLYDRSEADLGQNVHSPRYQDMVVGYLYVLKTISGSAIIADYAARWEALNTRNNRLRAYIAKARRKLVYR